MCQQAAAQQIDRSVPVAADPALWCPADRALTSTAAYILWQCAEAVFDAGNPAHAGQLETRVRTMLDACDQYDAAH
jgi:hypothetical protein